MSRPPARSRVSIARLGFGLIVSQLIAFVLLWSAFRGSPTSRHFLIFTGVLIALSVVWVIVAVRLLRRDRRALAAGIKRMIDEPFSAAPQLTTRDISQISETLTAALLDVHGRVDRLKAQLSQQRIIHQSMSTGMISLDVEQRVMSVNRAAEHMFGLHESTTLHRPLREFLHEPELNQLITQASRDGRSADAEITLHGHGRPSVHVIVEPLRSGAAENGDEALPRLGSAGLLVLIQDITRQRKLETMRSEFAANVSHELRTPITNIKGYVETLIETGCGDPAQTDQFLAVIKRNADRLGAIIEDLLALSRIEQTPFAGDLARQTMPVRPVIEAAIAHHEQASRAKQIAINLQADARLEAPIDAQLLEQALSNLLSNAIKYSPTASSITVTCDQLNQELIAIAVADQGPGISAEHLPRLFERFYRVDRARSREMGGTGLGLAIVKHIAQAHGGRAEVSSSLRRGSTFRIILPLR
jgi:two-component system, OmpR family, phosphate regulon sensor histidine kinase PhoR